MPDTEDNTLYVIEYRVGTPEDCHWRRSSAIKGRIAAIERARSFTGYKTYIKTYAESISIGLPEGWNGLPWERKDNS